MELKNSQLLPVDRDTAWKALNDPQALRAAIAGCEAIEATGENEYAVAMTASIGPVKARFKGRLTLADVIPPESYTLHFDGQGGPAGFGKGTARVELVPEGAGTRLHYVVHAQVGGEIAQVGQRLIDGAARKMADDFFARFGAALAAGAPAQASPPAPAPAPAGARAAWWWAAAALLALAGLFIALR